MFCTRRLISIIVVVSLSAVQFVWFGPELARTRKAAAVRKVEEEFQRAWKHADVRLKASVF